MEHPRILVISNQCLSKNTSNGRTLGSMFKGWPKECIAQFCLDLQSPDLDLCDNYYSVTDKEAIISLLHLKKQQTQTNNSTEDKPNRAGRPKYPLLMIFRDLVWKTGCWEKMGFKKWVEDFNPEMVLLQSGDSTFMLRIARQIAQKKNIPLAVYNSEGYYFFKKAWNTKKHWTNSIFFPIMKWMYDIEFERMMSINIHSVYLNDILQEKYYSTFKDNSDVIYNSSSIAFSPKPFNKENPRFSYLGNLGLDRPLALIQISEVIHDINANYKLDVYGAFIPGQEHIFNNAPYISYKGVIPYEQVKEVIADSDVLFHCEVSDEKWAEPLKYGFSTKIADAISIGHNFVLFAPGQIACSKYIKDTGAAWHAESESELKNVLRTIICDEVARDAKVEIAKIIAFQNHNEESNAKRFQNILINCYTKNR